jgi:hypothetical protein
MLVLVAAGIGEALAWDTARTGINKTGYNSFRFGGGDTGRRWGGGGGGLRFTLRLISSHRKSDLNTHGSTLFRPKQQNTIFFYFRRIGWKRRG